MFDHMAMWTGTANPKSMMPRLKAARVDVILPYVSKKRDTYEASNRLIEEAHRNGIKVHGWFGDEIKVDDAMPATVSALRQVAADGSPLGLLCPANPEACDYILGGLKRALTECDYDGISLEDGYVFDFKTTFTIRPGTAYPPTDDRARNYTTIPGCHCAYCLKHAPIGKPGWADWKRERVTDLIAAQARVIRQIRPGIPYSAALRMPYERAFYEPYKKEISFYDGWEFCQSRDGFSADWADWFKRGLIDFACPMSYFKSPRLIELQTLECHKLVPDAANRIWVGLTLGTPAESYPHDLSVLNGAAEIAAILNRLEEMGQKNCVFYSYEGLLDEHIPVLASHRKA
jgi:uncharacterized lipoprotein YddW (UPF0748 family)